MNKIPTLFVRDPDNPRYVTDQVTPGCEWVFDGEGVATRKWDGTCVMQDEAGRWWARREVKPGKQAPPNYVALSTDPNTGKTVGWEPIEQSSFVKFHQEALEGLTDAPVGTYELVGPKVNGNPENAVGHVLIQHGTQRLGGPPVMDYDHLHQWLVTHHENNLVEGVVWWRDPSDPDCDKAKLKAKDFPKEEA